MTVGWRNIPGGAGLWLLVLSVLLVTGITEVLLRVFLPAQLVSIGRDSPPNARLYGWGYAPRERIVVSDPDTGEVFVSLANNHGWRDQDRSFENPTDAFRILVLGDSVTFGVIVPEEAVYTRLLEDRLRKQGYNVEVLNIAYGGWSTDQELEALKNEGVRYRPDIVIVQVSENDVKENTANPEWGRPERHYKPFRYGLGPDGELRRKAVPVPKTQTDPWWESVLKDLVVRFEILKRAYLVYIDLQSGGKKALGDGYRIRVKQYQILVAAFGVSADDPLGRFLTPRIGEQLDKGELERAIESSSHADDKAEILRICKDNWFHEYWHGNYEYPATDSSSPGWRLFFALLREIKRETEAAGASLAVYSDQEMGYYAWERNWHRISPSPETRRNFLMSQTLLKQFATRNEIGFITPQVPHTRPLRDPHPNGDGNMAMAENIYRVLMERHQQALSKHRLEP